MLCWQLGNCSRKWEMTNIIFMKVTAPVIVQKTVDASFYLNAVFLGEVLKNEIMKEGKKGLSEAKLKIVALRRQKQAWTLPSLAKNYEFFFFNWRYSVLFLLPPISHTFLGCKICFELLVCLHRLLTYPEDVSLLSATVRTLPGNICIAGRQKLVGKVNSTCSGSTDVAGGHAETSKLGSLLLLKLSGNETGGILVYDWKT